MVSAEDAKARQLAVESIAKLQALVAEIDAKDATPPEPGPGAYAVTLRFRGAQGTEGQSYEYLFLKTPGQRGWYSTAARSGNGHFDTWENVWRWMNRKQVGWRSEFRPLLYSAGIIPASDA